jgi:hypothetical protein
MDPVSLSRTETTTISVAWRSAPGRVRNFGGVQMQTPDQRGFAMRLLRRSSPLTMAPLGHSVGTAANFRAVVGGLLRIWMCSWETSGCGITVLRFYGLAHPCEVIFDVFHNFAVEAEDKVLVGQPSCCNEGIHGRNGHLVISKVGTHQVSYLVK